MNTAVVTGANTGIGLAIAERFLKDGYALGYATAGNDAKHTGPLEALRATYGEGRITHVYGDVADPTTPKKLLEPFSTIDVLVNNAGLSTAKPFLELTQEDFDLTFAVDVRAGFLLAQEAARTDRENPKRSPPSSPGSPQTRGGMTQQVVKIPAAD
jgi:NAD(P)-dependent dehydrogenase (short-subunit alcohol dehydrogenase family)